MKNNPRCIAVSIIICPLSWPDGSFIESDERLGFILVYTIQMKNNGAVIRKCSCQTNFACNVAITETFKYIIYKNLKE